ncbi:response regulator transcription factor [Porphyromonas levii]|uniref:response regulator transcription factor n=1 Tax=Porphyromonas levii TaxID=28114 RepID=UPI00037F8A7F|nr:LuxR C-terminal-related transcriptional regulator [Porphyromonas levii]
MANKKYYSAVLALGDEGSACHLEHLLERQNTIGLHIERLKDPYTLVETTRELAPDILIVSPTVLSDPMVPTFREILGGQMVRIITYCTTLVEADMTKYFNGKILATDGENEVVNILEEVLEVESNDDSEMLLTPREQEVVIAVVKGLTNKEIADALFLSTHTIITHRRNIARKLNIHSPAGLTIYAIMNKLVTLEEIKGHI